VGSEWQISAGELFELMRPVAWAFSALISAFVFASARARGFRSYAIIAWTLGTLLFPFIILPLYLIVRALSRGRDKPSKIFAASPAWKRIWPVLYLVAVLSIIALFFYKDYRSLDAHLWRANNAKLRGPQEKVITEYRAALQIEDDAHTHKLLAIELAAAGRAEEALAEFRTAERKGEPDDRIPYYTATMLDTLHREAEAALEYKRFMDGPLCTQALPDANCATARARVQAIAPNLAVKQK
jgi:tetratricopeptide (TPR) repeat protein